VSNEGKITEEEIQEALKTDPKAIAYRDLIVKIEKMLGTVYSQRVEADYWDYVNKKYRNNI
jgi:hypothetical protein